ncbi:hypothetical protein KHQ06_08055 [Nocardia tengchongensis]|uniref:Uncharacterized protein n=1 Tax=Nocardia tengchongensis TaxID=2055889 RepID=A0ABX8CWN2_9NOCA|nr:hypothetical protein [Nocardia tengchongensis]QVI22905.1 hypothetical protein KHQ06_08055 [Nocardia tengchongensis]
MTDEMGLALHTSATEAELEALNTQRNRLDGFWYRGPHAEQWRYLNRAFSTWAFAPEEARKHFEWAEYYRDEIGQDQLTAVQWRSVEQAQELSGNTFQVDYERNAPDTYRCAPGTPILRFGADRDRPPIERER